MEYITVMHNICAKLYYQYVPNNTYQKSVELCKTKIEEVLKLYIMLPKILPTPIVKYDIKPDVPMVNIISHANYIDENDNYTVDIVF